MVDWEQAASIFSCEVQRTAMECSLSIILHADDTVVELSSQDDPDVWGSHV